MIYSPIPLPFPIGTAVTHAAFVGSHLVVDGYQGSDVVVRLRDADATFTATVQSLAVAR